MDKVFATLRTVGVLLGIWIVLAVVGIATGVIPFPGVAAGAPTTGGDEVADGGAEPAADAGMTDGGDAGPSTLVAEPEPAPEVAPEEAAPASGPTEGVRWSVCVASSNPSLAVGDIFGDGRPEVIVGCEDGWHVIGLAVTGPARIALFTAPDAPAGQERSAGPAAIGDVDGDGTPDLVFPLAFLGDNGASRGGGLFWVPRNNFGGIDEPQGLAPITAVSAVVAPIDGSDGGEVVAMNRANARAQLPSEAWVFTGGAAPTRSAVLVTGPNGSAALVADVDRDGNADVVALSDGRVDLHFGDGGSAFGRNHTLAIPGTREIALGDLDGDGGTDIVVLGDGGLRWIRAGALEGMEPRGIDGVPANLRNLQVADFDGDGHLDLAGWDHPRLVVLRQRDAVDFEPRDAFTLRGGPFGPRRHRIADLDADGHLDDLVLLGTAAGVGAPLEVIFLTDALDGAELSPAAEARPIPDAPLVIRAALR